LGKSCILAPFTFKQPLIALTSKYTLEALIAMASSGNVDTQRETRWPGKSTNSVQIDFASDSEEDLSDEEFYPNARDAYVADEVEV
jgi:hypothetical protein